MSQNADILYALKHGSRITPMNALRLFGCMRLSGRIYDLRAQGERIESRMMNVGKGKRVAVYYMEKTR